MSAQADRPKTLQGKVALVAGATRGAGRGISCMLGEAGAKVYCTGRSSRTAPRAAGSGAPFDLTRRPETIEHTAEMVTARGGQGVAVQVDHTDEAQVEALIEKVRAEDGHLDILVNNIWGCDELTEWGTPFWELSLEKGAVLLERAVFTHIITSRHTVPLMFERPGGLIIEVTDGEDHRYRGSLYYDLAKVSLIRLAFGMAEELRPFKMASVALTPGFLRSEAMLDHFGVTEATWRKAIQKDPHFAASETPFYVGRAVAALAADANVFAKTGKVLTTWGLADEYGFADMDGSKPNWGKYFKENIAGTL